MVGQSAGLFPQVELAWVGERVNRMIAADPRVRREPPAPASERPRSRWFFGGRRAVGRLA